MTKLHKWKKETKIDKIKLNFIFSNVFLFCSFNDESIFLLYNFVFVRKKCKKFKKEIKKKGKESICGVK